MSFTNISSKFLKPLRFLDQRFLKIRCFTFVIITKSFLLLGKDLRYFGKTLKSLYEFGMPVNLSLEKSKKYVQLDRYHSTSFDKLCRYISPVRKTTSHCNGSSRWHGKLFLFSWVIKIKGSNVIVKSWKKNITLPIPIQKDIYKFVRLIMKSVLTCSTSWLWAHAFDFSSSKIK